MIDYNALDNMFDDDYLAKDWYNYLMHEVSYEVFNRQEEIVYMSGELGKGRLPKIKDEAPEVIRNIIASKMAFFTESMTANILKSLIESNIDCSTELATELNEWYGSKEGREFEGRDD